MHSREKGDLADDAVESIAHSWRGRPETGTPAVTGIRRRRRSTIPTAMKMKKNIETCVRWR